MVTRKKTTKKTRRTTKKKPAKKRTVKKKTTRRTTKKRTTRKKATKKRAVKKKSAKLTDVKGVGEVMARALKRAGVKDIKSLARRKPAILAKITYGKQRKEVGRKTAGAIVRAAKRLVKKK